MHQRFVFLLSVTITVFCRSGIAADPHSPVIPGFERFHANNSEADVDGGRLLVNELNCAACHANLKTESTIAPRSAPILSDVGSRIHRDYLKSFIANPHQTKPGTTLPNLFGGMSESEKTVAVDSLVEFLATTGSVSQIPPNKSGAVRGEKLFHTIGCLACHNSRKPNAKQLSTSVPLIGLNRKYTVGSLIAFLRNPHAVRPSGRMPNLNLTETEAVDIASYFLKDVDVPANVKYSYYEGKWESLPDFSAMIPKTKGLSPGIDISVRERNEEFGLVFEGYLHIASDTNATIHLGSDDGSRVLIDGQEVVATDGIHAHSTSRANVKLSSGSHKVVVQYFEAAGEQSLAVEIEFKKLPKQSLGSLLTLTENAEAPKAAGANTDPSKITKGRELFSSLGCASCHEMKVDDQRIASSLKSPVATGVGGCLSKTSTGKAPYFGLSDRQHQAIVAALGSTDALGVDPKSAVAWTMKTMNCYACHKRDELGGPEMDREASFKSLIPEMGDEGRIPPPLDGVGDKLTAQWLKHVMDNGANDRPYMQTRMPKFGQANVGKIVEAFSKVDQKNDAAKVVFATAPHRVRSSGRKMVGDNGGLACVKCHYFGKYKATGIQALDLTTMTQRLRKDWFQRYLINPQNFRPGTRMPTGFPGGVSVLRDMLDGEPNTQVAAIWEYLKLGKKAPLPSGLTGGLIELTPTTEPIIYRNFIEGLSPRGIAVGYPEKAHLAWDAEQFSIGLIWHGAFMDASKHWNGRGQGRQSPMGDHVMTMVKGQPFARLRSGDSEWPTEAPRESDYRFKGYNLDASGRPVFRYQFGSVSVEDHAVPIANKLDATFERTLRLTSEDGQPLTFRAAAADSIVVTDEGRFLIDNAFALDFKVTGGGKPVVRQRGGKSELIVPVTFSNGRAEIVEQIIW